MIEKNYTLQDIYAEYKKRGGTLTKEEYRTACSIYNEGAMRHIIEHGRALDMGHGLASISIVKRERDFTKRPRVNWGASQALKAQIIADGGTPLHKDLAPHGEPWFVYFTHKWWLRFYWRKSQCRIPNQKLYKFTPTGGAKGNRGKLVDILRSDGSGHTRFDNAKDI